MRKLLAALIAALFAAGLATSAFAGSTPPVKTAKVDVDNYQYKPGSFTIKRGTKVVWKWVNGSDVRHDIHVAKGPIKFRSKLQAKGTFSHLFNRPGKYVLVCTVHPLIMRETVIVK
jgi:plastocyanin